MKQIGYVRDTINGMADVEVRRASACGDNCASCGGGCSVPVTRVRIKNSLGAEKGDLVEVKLQTKFVMQFAFIVYIIPLVMLIAGTAFGISIFKSMGIINYESLGFLTGLVLLGVSFIFLRQVDKRIKNSDRLKFEMVRIISS